VQQASRLLRLRAATETVAATAAAEPDCPTTSGTKLVAQCLRPATVQQASRLLRLKAATKTDGPTNSKKPEAAGSGLRLKK